MLQWQFQLLEYRWNDLTSGITGLPGFIVLCVFMIILFFYDRFIGKDKILTNQIGKFLLEPW